MRSATPVRRLARATPRPLPTRRAAPATSASRGADGRRGPDVATRELQRNARPRGIEPRERKSRHRAHAVRRAPSRATPTRPRRRTPRARADVRVRARCDEGGIGRAGADDHGERPHRLRQPAPACRASRKRRGSGAGARRRVPKARRSRTALLRAGLRRTATRRSRRRASARRSPCPARRIRAPRPRGAGLGERRMPEPQHRRGARPLVRSVGPVQAVRHGLPSRDATNSRSVEPKPRSTTGDREADLHVNGAVGTRPREHGSVEWQAHGPTVPARAGPSRWLSTGEQQSGRPPEGGRPQ